MRELLELFGDFCWDQRPSVFGHPQFAAVVPSIEVAVRELRDLYPADVCREMVAKGAASIILGLFVEGEEILPGVHDLLLLGTDLALYKDWRERKKLIGHLRSFEGWDAAQFEVGVQAGLVRVGLIPEPEPAANKAAKCPDFVVSVGATTVAIELKTLRARQSEVNRLSVEEALAHRQRTLPYEWNKDIVFQLAPATIAALDMQTQRFEREHLPAIEEALRAVFDRVHHETRIPVGSFGELLVTPPPAWAGESYAGGGGVLPDEQDPEFLLHRALLRAQEAAEQLGAVRADVRIFVVWGSRSTLRAVPAAAAARARIVTERERWAPHAIDWIVFFNGHTLGPNGQWTIDIATCQVSENALPIPPVILEGITRWGEGRVH